MLKSVNYRTIILLYYGILCVKLVPYGDWDWRVEMTIVLPKLKHKKDLYTTNEERFALLKEIENLVQNSTGDLEKQKILRQQIVIENPDIFYPLYKDYELSPKHKDELNKLIDRCSDCLSLTPGLASRICDSIATNYKGQLLKDILSFFMKDSGINEFKGAFSGKVIDFSVEKMDAGIAGYAQHRSGDEHKIAMAESDIQQDGVMEPVDTLFHELLHTTQEKGAGNFEALSALYYVDSSCAKKNEAWRGKVASAYKNQPIEKEAWYFGENMSFVARDPAKRSNVEIRMRKLVETLTGIKPSIVERDKYKMVDGMFAVELNQELDATESELRQIFGRCNYNSKTQTIFFPFGKDDIPLEYLGRLIEGAKKAKQTMNERTAFKQKLSALFSVNKKMPSYPQGVILDGANPEAQEWVNSWGTNVKTKIRPDGNLWIFCPLSLQKDGKEIQYSDTFQTKYGMVLGRGGNYRALVGGDGHLIVPRTLKKEQVEGKGKLLDTLKGIQCDTEASLRKAILDSKSPVE